MVSPGTPSQNTYEKDVPADIPGISATPALQQSVEAPSFNPATIKEFTPQNYDLANSVRPTVKFSC